MLPSQSSQAVQFWTELTIHLQCTFHRKSTIGVRQWAMCILHPLCFSRVDCSAYLFSLATDLTEKALWSPCLQGHHQELSKMSFSMRWVRFRARQIWALLKEFETVQLWNRVPPDEADSKSQGTFKILLLLSMARRMVFELEVAK